MKKIPKIILLLSFLPYVFILLYSLYSAFFGFTFFFNTSYGFEGFTDSIVIMGFLLCYIPIIPSCLLYQLSYLIVFIIKKRNFNKYEKNLWLIAGILFAIAVFKAVFIYTNI